ncbi:MAG: hypothetical protein DSZ08_04835, partial [Sulfurovum sp.]
MIKHKAVSNYKIFLLVFLTLASLFGAILIANNLDFTINGVHYIPKILVFDTFFVEYAIMFLLIVVLINKYPFSRWFGTILFIVYMTIYLSQIISIFISGEFISKLAVKNIEFIGFLITTENISIILLVMLVVVILPLILTYFIVKNVKLQKIMLNRYFIGFFITATLLLYGEEKWISQKTLQERNTILQHNTLPHMAAIQAFENIYKSDEKVDFSFTRDEVEKLHKLGYTFKPFKKYPLLKENIYDENVTFDATIQKPNIIVIFTEGLSARTTSVYSDKYKNLTPHLKDFSENPHTTVVKNYYNHTAATYRGLHGQICSTYPWLGSGKNWLENDLLNLSTLHYKCFPHILQHNGYETIFLNMHYKDSSGNDEMVANFGFDTILSGETLSNTYLGGIDKIRGHYLSDHQAYTVLTKYLKEKEKTPKKQPFLLMTYTIETHAFVDIERDGVAYGDGKNNVLNTIYNMDDAFGQFWDYFKHSKFAKNTMIVFTSDHAHYYGKEYIRTMKQ